MGGVSLIAGSQQSRAADRQTQATTQAANQTDATNRYIFDTIRADNAQGRSIGNAASAQMARLLGLDFQTQPTNALTNGGMMGRTYPGLMRGGNSGGNMGGNTSYPPGADGFDGPQINGGPNGVIEGDFRVTGEGQAQPMGNALNPTDWLRSTPGYEFNFNEGLRGMSLALANRGQLLSGDAAREAQRYGQNYADRIYGDQWNRLAGLAGYGQTANSASQQAGQAYASGTAANNWNRAQSLGSSYQNQANAWTNALGGVAGAGLYAINNWPGQGGSQNALRGYLN